jgi:DNA-directed RNA polymerase subunit K/omega
MPPKKKPKKKIINLDSESTLISDSEDYIENSDSGSDIYIPGSNENIDDEYGDDDDLDDDKNEIDDEDAYGKDDPDNNELDIDDNCLYKLSKNHIDDIDSDDDYGEDLETENKGKEILLEGDDRITDPIMTKYEYVRIIGNRAKQIAMGSKKFVKNVGNLDSKEIAISELRHKMIPYKIKRPLPNNRYEVWTIKELQIPDML